MDAIGIGALIVNYHYQRPIQILEKKFEKNIERDKKKEKELLDLGWIVLVFWECKIKTNIKDCINKIKASL